MEKTSAARPVRSSYRRLIAKLGLSLAVLGGGGYGSYYAITTAPQNDADTSAVARSADQLNAEELKELFSSPPPQAESKPSAADDRYTLTSAKSETDFDSPVSTKSAQVKQAEPISTTTMLGDRYATIVVEPEEALEPELAEEPKTEVARGQEPDSFNPLRSATEKPAAQPTETARGSAPPTTPNRPQISSSEMFAGTPSVSSLPTSPAAGRYAQQTAPNAQRPAPAAPPVDFGPAEVVAQQRPAPAYNLTPEPPMAAEPEPAAAPLAVASRMPNPTLGSPTPTPGLTKSPGTGRPGERLLEGPQSPSVTIQKLAPEEIQVGRRCTFAIRVQNTGQRTAQGVVVHDEIPLGTELVGTAPRASVSGSKVLWDIGTLSVGEERTVEMELIPTEEGELGSVASVTFAAQASAKARCTRPELALRLSSKPQVHAGEQHLVQIEVSNPGSGEATGVMLLETVPEGVSHEAGPALEFEVGSLAPGESRSLELILTAEAAGKVSNVMTARADAGLQVQAGCDFEVIAPALQVSVEGPKKRYLERPATYQVSIDNPGTASAKEVELVTQLPKGLQFVSANNMGEYDPGSHSVHWSLAELPANERGTVELVALPIETGEHTLQVSTKASEGLQDVTEAHVQVDGIVALMFEVVDLESPVEIGGETTYEIRVVNQGSKSAANVQVGAIMPQGMRAISGQGETRHAIQGERVVFAPLAQLAPKAESVFRIQAQGLRAGDQRVRVQVVSDEVRQPITKEVSTRVYADQ